jgi:hypothetical protein
VSTPIELPEGWKSWPLPAKRYIRTLLVRLRDGQQNDPPGSLLAVLDDLERAEEATTVRDHDAAIAAIQHARDRLLGLGDL